MFFLATKRSQQPCDLISLWNWSHSFILKRVTNTCVQLLGSSLRLQLYTVAMFVLVDYGSTAIEAQMFNSNVTCDILLAAIAIPYMFAVAYERASLCARTPDRAEALLAKADRIHVCRRASNQHSCDCKRRL